MPTQRSDGPSLRRFARAPQCMAASSFNLADSPEPFFRYLTVFRSRLGLANLVLAVTTVGPEPDRALRRRIRQVLEHQTSLSLGDSSNEAVLEYLVQKKIVGSIIRSSGRYRGTALMK